MVCLRSLSSQSLNPSRARCVIVERLLNDFQAVEVDLGLLLGLNLLKSMQY